MKKSILVLAFILINIIVFADTYIIMEPEEVIRKATLILEVNVKDVVFEPLDNSDYGYARLTLEVIDRIKGTCPDEIIARRYGYTKDGQYLKTEYRPAFYKNEHFIICFVKDKEDNYCFIGLYRGKYSIDNGKIKGTNITLTEFKRMIVEIDEGKKEKFPNELPRPISILNEVTIDLDKNTNKIKTNNFLSNPKSCLSTAHMNGKFETTNMSLSSSSLAFHYNPAGAPSNCSISNIETSIGVALGIWNAVSYKNFSFSYSDTTSEGPSTDPTQKNVIYWIHYNDINPLAESNPYPQSGGYGTVLGVDIQFNNYSGLTWRLYSDYIDSRSAYYPDFIDVLVHELGHPLGLDHVDDHYQIMQTYYDQRELTVRTLGDGDKAGISYLYPSSNISLYGGNLNHSLVLSANSSTSITISGNVTIPSGMWFELEYGKATININSGCSIVKSSGGTFIDGGGNTWNPDIRLTSGGNLVGHYYDIISALSAASSGQTVIIPSNLSITSSITVPVGVTLQINSGVTLSFGSGLSLTVNGTLNANGATFQGNGNTWNGIIINSTASGYITYCNISNASEGIKFNTTDLTCQFNTISYCNTGIYFDGTGSSDLVRSNYIYQNTTSIRCEGSSYPNIFPCNKILNNNVGAYISSLSSPDFGRYIDQGHNSISNALYDINSGYASTIYAEYNWWGQFPAYPSIIGTVDYTNALTSDPNPSSVRTPVSENEQTIYLKTMKSNNSTANKVPGLSEVDKARGLFSKGRYEESLAAFESILEKYPDYLSGQIALVFIDECLNKLYRKSEIMTILNEIIRNN